MTTSHDDLAAAFNDIRDALLEALDALNRAVGHAAYAQELATNQAAGNTEITTRVIAAVHLKPGMHLVVGSDAYEISGIQFSKYSVRVFVTGSPFAPTVEYTYSLDDDVRILDNTEPEEDMTPIPTRLLNQLREATPHVVVACNSERDELQPMRYAIAEHDTAKAILAAVDGEDA